MRNNVKDEHFTSFMLWSWARENIPRFSQRMKMRGIYSGLSSPKEYGGKMYGTMVDPVDGNSSVTVRIPANLVSLLEPLKGQVIEVDGIPYWSVKAELGKAEIVFDVAMVRTIEEENVSQMAPATIMKTTVSEFVKEKRRRGWKSVERAIMDKFNYALNTHELHLAGDGDRFTKIPRVGILIGESGIVDKDIETAIGKYLKFYTLKFHRVSMTSAESLKEALAELDNMDFYDVIGIARGGGAGLEVFNDPDLANACLELKTPFVTALGHADDVSLLDLVADQSFPTPTALGKYLNELADHALAINKWKLHVFSLREREKSLNEIVKDLESKLYSTRAKLITTWLIIGFVILGIIGLVAYVKTL